MRLKLYYIAEPYRQTQKWGVYNPQVYARFGFTKHNGEDVALGTDKNIYAPVRSKVAQVDYHPTGAGIFVSVITLDEFDEWEASSSKPHKVYLTFMHLKKAKVNVGDILEVGDVIAEADNTGYSTGSHTHIFAGRVLEENGVYRFVDEALKEANYSFDHTRYYCGEYALDFKNKRLQEEKKKLEQILYTKNAQLQLTLMQEIILLIKKWIEAIK